MTDVAQTFRDEMLEANADEAAQSVAQKASATIAHSMLAAARAANQMESQFRGGFSDLPAERQLFSMGEVCRTFGVAPQVVRAICRAGGIQPALTIDSRPYFDGGAYVQIGNAIREASSK